MLKFGVKSPSSTLGHALEEVMRPPAAAVDRMSNRRRGSIPAFTPSTMASAATAMLPIDIMLLTSLTTEA